MRGKTNLRDGIFLNATTEKKQIATSQTITAGDFVEYDAIKNMDKITNPYLEADISNTEGCYRINSDLYMLINKNYLTLLNSSFVVLQTLTFDNITDIKIINDYIVVNGDKLTLFKIDGQKLTKTDEITSHYRYRLAKLNSNEIISADITTDYNKKAYIIANIYAFNNDKFEVKAKGVTAYADTSYSSTPVTICIFNESENKIAILVQEQSSTASTCGAYHFAIDESDYAISYIEGEFIRSALAHTGTSRRFTTSAINPYNNTILFEEGSNQYISSLTIQLLCSNKGEIFKSAKIKPTDYFKELFQGLAIYSSWNAIGYSSSIGVNIVKENVFYITFTPQYVYSTSNYRIAVVRCEIRNELLVFSNSIFIDFYKGDFTSYFYGCGYVFENDNGDVKFGFIASQSSNDSYYGSYYVDLSYKNGILSVGKKTSYVRRFGGDGNPIGVAKQSGTAGQTIEVYIPSSEY